MNMPNSNRYWRLTSEVVFLTALALSVIGPSRCVAQHAGKTAAEELARDDPADVALLKAKWGPGRVVTDINGNVTDFCPVSDDFVGSAKLQHAASRMRHVRFFSTEGKEKGVTLTIAAMASSRTLQSTDLSGEVTDDALGALEKVQSLTRISILSDHVTDGAFLHLGKLRNLEDISIGSPKADHKVRINGSGLKAIRGLKNLRELDLADCPVDDDGVANLRGLNIRELYLDSSLISDQGVQLIGRIKSLERLAIRNAAITDKAFQHFARLKDLWGLGLMHCYLLDGRGVKELANLKKLTCLCLTECPIDDAALKHLKGVRLNALNLQQTKITDQAVDEILNIPTLDELYVGSTKITNAGLARLKAVKGLRVNNSPYEVP